MIESLTLSDFALVDKLTLELDERLTVLTGETGAGKSILLQALGCLLGDRVSRELVRTGAEEARVEGCFVVKGQAAERVRALLDEADIPWEEVLVVRRLVKADGKSRATVNGQTVGLALLSVIGAELVEVSSQHQHQALLDEANHVDILDRALSAEGAQVLKKYTERFEEWEAARKKVARLEKMESEGAERIDFLKFQIDEIRGANLVSGEDGGLERERELLGNAEKLTESYGTAEVLLYSGEDSAVDCLGRAMRSLERAVVNDPEAQGIIEMAKEASASLEEASSRLRERLQAVRADPERLELVEDRIQLIRRLERKHGAGVAGILDKLEKMEAELWEVENRQSVMEDARSDLEVAAIELGKSGEALSKQREVASTNLHGMVGRELAPLGIIEGAFLVELQRCEAGPKGMESVRFMFGPNPGEEPKPLARIASGGELSRVMLAVKSALRDSSVGSLVFDEVDAGIGGTVADRVAERLEALSDSCQVLCVTHLPQIASKATRHLKVEKQASQGRTVTRVTAVEGDRRVEELARMLGGDGVAAFEHARELAGRAQ